MMHWYNQYIIIIILIILLVLYITFVNLSKCRKYCNDLLICLWPMTTTSHRAVRSGWKPPSRLKLRYRLILGHCVSIVPLAATAPLCFAHGVWLFLSALSPTLKMNVSSLCESERYVFKTQLHSCYQHSKHNCCRYPVHSYSLNLVSL